MIDINSLMTKYKAGALTGHDLANMVNEGKITKADRRKITRSSQKKELSQRQILRLESKAKKQLPRLTAADRHLKYVVEKNETIREKIMQKTMICLGCREQGHILKYCPNAKVTQAVTPSSMNKLICFNCGQTDHALRACPQPQTPGYLPYAECFICKENGHIARDCNANPNGLYPNGGCCHICFKKDHLVKDCPQKQTSSSSDNEEDNNINNFGQQKKMNGKEIRLKTIDDTNIDGGGDDEDIYDDNKDLEEEEDNDNEGDEKKSRKSKSKKLKSSSNKDKKRKRSEE